MAMFRLLLLAGFFLAGLVTDSARAGLRWDVQWECISQLRPAMTVVINNEQGWMHAELYPAPLTCHFLHVTEKTTL